MNAGCKHIKGTNVSCFFFFADPFSGLDYDCCISGEGWLTLILSVQSVVLDARMHESLAKAATVAGGSTATKALASSAHFLCSGSDTVHHRIFLAVMQGVQTVSQKIDIHLVQNLGNC